MLQNTVSSDLVEGKFSFQLLMKSSWLYIGFTSNVKGLLET